MAKTNYTPEETKHTPTPWTVQACYSGATTIATMRSPDRILCINAPDDATPAGYEATETNAAFLVEACNSYDSLRSRLLAAEAELDAANQDVKIGKAQREEIIERARAAEQERDELRKEREDDIRATEPLWAVYGHGTDDEHWKPGTTLCEAAAHEIATLRASLAAAEGEVERWKEEARIVAADRDSWASAAREHNADKARMSDELAAARLRNQELERLLDAGASAVEDLMTDPAWIALHKHGWAALKAWAPAARAAIAAPSEETR